jgi:hypothetical protein
MHSEAEKKPEPKEPAEEPVKGPEEPPPDDAEFKITVRKLTMPVRPRGVLAE